MGALAEILVVCVAVVLGIIILVNIVGPVFRSVGWVFKQIFRFIGGEVTDIARFIGAGCRHHFIQQGLHIRHLAGVDGHFQNPFNCIAHVTSFGLRLHIAA